MLSETSEPTEPPQVVFRGKKRKVYRQRADEIITKTDKPEQTDNAPNSDVARAASPTSTDEDGLPVAEALRRRNARRARIGGVAFAAAAAPKRVDGQATEQSLVVHRDSDAQPLEAYGMSQRFAPQTGLVGELVNKHMEEYVEFALARRNRSAPESSEPLHRPTSAQASVTTVTGPPGSATAQTIMQGRLQEVDLGEESRARNIAQTERARRRLQGLPDEEESEETNRRAKKPRLGRDGKPWRPRNRRGSDEVKRDKLVEQFLSENRLDIYDVQPEKAGAATAATATAADEGDGGADERLAEEFRREFMDAMAARRQKKKQPAAPTKPGEEVLKGPKLGGSRNQRAQMRDILLREQEKKR